VLIHNGKLFEDVMAKAQLTRHELQAASPPVGLHLRRGGPLGDSREQRARSVVVLRKNHENGGGRRRPHAESGRLALPRRDPIDFGEVVGVSFQPTELAFAAPARARWPQR